MLCFLCKHKYSSLNLLVEHFKKSHQLGTNSTYRCYEVNCLQSFYNLSSFKKHVLRKHAKSDIEYNAEQNESLIKKTKLDNFDNGSNCSVQVANEDICRNIQSSDREFNLNLSLLAMRNFIIEFTMTLHDNNSFSRKNVYEIQESVQKKIIDPILDIFMNFAFSRLKEHYTIQNEMHSILSELKSLFQHCSSDYLLNKWLSLNGYVDEIKEFTINNEITNTFHNGKLIYNELHIKGIVMPLTFQFKRFFESNNNLEHTLNQQKSLENNDKFINFVQGNLWKTKMESYKDKNVIPYFLYVDDLEINNPLGSNARTHSICNFYYSFPTLSCDESKLTNIFLAATIKSIDMQCYGNNKCLKYLIEELKSLETNGIEITTNQGTIHVYFILGLILGDNLGVNSILGFKKSFSSHSYCRFCKATKNQCQVLCSEDNSQCRNIENYETDVELNDSQQTGILSESLFNSIPSFHVTKNFSVDVMHDVFEGICHYDLCHILEYFIYKMKYFSLETLNSRKQTFEYGSIEMDNLSGEITQPHINNRHLKMSAREMMTFIMYFPIMVEDLIPADDDVWLFLINLIEIIDLLLCFEVTETSITSLQQKIKYHNENYVILFNDNLKPKFHNLIHYPTIIRQSGPVRKFWCFKFEAKHKQFKLYSSAITSRKNICITLAKKFQLKFANSLLQANNQRLYNFDNKYQTDTIYSDIISKMLNVCKDELKFYSKICYNGKRYQNQVYISTFKNDIQLHKILTIVVHKEVNIFLFCQDLNSIQFNPHYLAFDVDLTVLGNFVILEINNLVGPPLNVIKTARGKTVIRVKEYYQMLA